MNGQPPSPSSNLSHLDSSITFNPLGSPYNGSYNNSPYSAHSELSYIGESDLSFPGFLDEDSASAIRDYDPADYDAPHQSSLLMFSDTDFMNSSYETGLSVMGAEIHSNQSYDYSSPSSNASAEDRNRSRASSVSSNPHSHHPTSNLYTTSPRLDVAQSFENLKFSPTWGTEPLPLSDPGQKHPSPPRLLMPDGPPTINAPDGNGPPDGSASGPSLHIVPATPISGGGLTNDAVTFQSRLGNLSAFTAAMG
ncbi:hypothetical protein M378DRAFT_793522 [Amanita muscaria Koide BX008]|uniref:Uncharacterized protein n=1 Tax=Amanita muscaria (strain Koide BX008) TaxID=946122 RepID=A0A0C2WLD9_AMAMK|nr:hypothetical protein M378DRAFT_793522 [Amanita muscaria Koide BX008]